jgi:hypothetical protein
MEPRAPAKIEIKTIKNPVIEKLYADIFDGAIIFARV